MSNLVPPVGITTLNRIRQEDAILGLAHLTGKEPGDFGLLLGALGLIPVACEMFGRPVPPAAPKRSHKKQVQPRTHRDGTPVEHGSVTMYRRELRAGKPPCAACREADRIDGVNRRERVGKPKKPPYWKTEACGTPSGYYAHKQRGEPTCEACRADRRERYAKRKKAQRESSEEA